MDKELKGSDLTLTALNMLIGKEGVDFSYLEGPRDDPAWWTLRLYINRN